jgi:hypothetical protein
MLLRAKAREKYNIEVKLSKDFSVQVLNHFNFYMKKKLPAVS